MRLHLSHINASLQGHDLCGGMWSHRTVTQMLCIRAYRKTMDFSPCWSVGAIAHLTARNQLDTRLAGFMPLLPTWYEQGCAQ